jgi:hypothetical protein
VVSRCVPCVSRLPPVSFYRYRYRYSYIPVTRVSHRRARTHPPRMTVLLLGLACATMTVPVPAPARKLTPLTDGLALGFDFGTSGVRCCLLESRDVIWDDSVRWDQVTPLPAPTDRDADGATSGSTWSSALFQLLRNVPKSHFKDLHRICISGTSSSMSLMDIDTGRLTRPVKM